VGRPPPVSREDSSDGDGASESRATDGGVGEDGLSAFGCAARCFRLAASLGGVFLDGMVGLLAWVGGKNDWNSEISWIEMSPQVKSKRDSSTA
jgi:hypothetical protein